MDWVLDRFGLARDADGRAWRTAQGTVVFRSDTWAGPAAVDDEPETASGERLLIPLDELTPILRKTGLQLVILVQVGRERHLRRHEREERWEPNRLFDYFCVYLVRDDGEIVTI
jgi:hypothetical protein